MDLLTKDRYTLLTSQHMDWCN